MQKINLIYQKNTLVILEHLFIVGIEIFIKQLKNKIQYESLMI